MSDFLSGAGLFMCIGGIVLLGLIIFAASRLFGNRGQNRLDRDDDKVWDDKRGSEQPRYDSPDVQSRGGFGNAPRTGGTGGRINRAPSGRQTRGIFGGSSGGSGRRGSRPLPGRGTQSGESRNLGDRDDDDNIKSGGGFGG